MTKAELERIYLDYLIGRSEADTKKISNTRVELDRSLDAHIEEVKKQFFAEGYKYALKTKLKKGEKDE